MRPTSIYRCLADFELGRGKAKDVKGDEADEAAAIAKACAGNTRMYRAGDPIELNLGDAVSLLELGVVVLDEEATKQRNATAAKA